VHGAGRRRGHRSGSNASKSRARAGGHYRIPIFVYRKSKFAEAKIATPPRTYQEVGALGPLLTKQNQMAYGTPSA
jgi:hypothetical protein